MTRRDAGVDLMRVTATWMVIVLHVLGEGGVIAGQTPRGPGYYAAWALEVLCYCAVDCYGLISGFIGRSTVFKPGRLLEIWLEVVFYSGGVTLLFHLLRPETASWRNVILACFPVTRGIYWYFAAYFAVSFLAPYFNLMLDALSKKQAKALLLSLAAVFSIYPTVNPTDIFSLHYGYSALWLMLLYLMGGCLGRLREDIRIPRPLFLLGYFAGGGAVLCSMLVLRRVPALERFETALVTYVSFPVLLCAVCLLLFFQGLPIRSKALASLAALASPLSFGVYLLHTQPWIWGYVLSGRFVSYGALPVWQCLPAVMVTAAGIFAVCGCVDFLRLKLFALVKGGARRRGLNR